MAYVVLFYVYINVKYNKYIPRYKYINHAIRWLHIIANISNMALYSGDIVPWSENTLVKWLTNDATILEPDHADECDK